MRLSGSSSSFRFLSVATTDFTTMSSRPPYGGGRNQWRWGLSDGSSSGRGNLMTRESHCRTVIEVNLAARPQEVGGFYPRQFVPRPEHHQIHNFNLRPSEFNQPSVCDSRPCFRQYQAFNLRPRGSQNRSYHPREQFLHDRNENSRRIYHPNQYNDQKQPRHQKQQFAHSQSLRPQPPRPSDYRQWEYSRAGPPPHCERFTILSYNILADYLAKNHRPKLYCHIPPYMLDWEWRKRNLIFELGLWSADIMCFQEVDRFHDLNQELKFRGYSGIWKMRTGDPVDGCAIFWRTSRKPPNWGFLRKRDAHKSRKRLPASPRTKNVLEFKLLHEECIVFNKLDLRDNVAQICVLESTANEKEKTSNLQTSSACSNKVVVCNIHVLYNPRRGEIKLGQVRLLLDKAHAVSQIWNNAPIVLCGDFNCTPKSPLYNFISERKLDLSEIPRDKVSGQASAEIHTPWRQRPNTRTDIAIQQAGSLSTTEMQNLPNRTEENVPSTNNQELQCSDTIPDTSENYYAEGNKGIKDALLTDENGKISLQYREDYYRNKMEKTTLVGDDLSEVSTSAYHDEGFLNIPTSRSLDDGESFVSVASSYKGIQPNAVRVEKLNPTSSSDSDLSGDLAQLEQSSSIGPDTYEGAITSERDGYFGEVRNNSNPMDSSSDNLTRTSVPSDIGVPLENQPFDDQDGNFGEDSVTLLSELTGDGFPSDIVQLKYSSRQSEVNSWAIDPEKSSYDSSAWTPADRETATGDADCTTLEHPLKLKSTYTETENLSETRDLNGEPLVTSYNRCFLGTVDYIWRSEGLETVRVLAPMPKPAMRWTEGFPTKKWGSDHIALASELAFVNKVEDQKADQQRSDS